MHDSQNTPRDLVISVRLSAGTYTARVRGEKATASSTISADTAARALASKLGADLPQPDLFAANRGSTEPHVTFSAQRSAPFEMKAAAIQPTAVNPRISHQNEGGTL